ncbi:MAG: hypothetical protein ABFD92_21320 [Planctomycetaceae bacterium]
MTEAMWEALFTQMPVAGVIIALLVIWNKQLDKWTEKVNGSLLEIAKILARMEQLQTNGNTRLASMQETMTEHEKEVAGRPCIMAKQRRAAAP